MQSFNLYCISIYKKSFLSTNSFLLLKCYNGISELILGYRDNLQYRAMMIFIKNKNKNNYSDLQEAELTIALLYYLKMVISCQLPLIQYLCTCISLYK